MRETEAMDHPDIFFEIAIRLRDSTLLSLFHYPFRELIVSLISNNNFWYRRSEHLVGRTLEPREGDQSPDLTWKRIYYTLVKAEEDESKNKLFFGLDYLPSALVIIEVYNPESLPTSARLIDAGITTDVLEHLLLSGHIVFQLEGAGYMLGYNDEDLVMNKLILSYLATRNWQQVDDRIQQVVRDAIEGGRLEVVKDFIESGMVATEARYLFWYAARAKEPVPMLSYLLSHYPISHYREEVMNILVRNDNVQGMIFFLKDVYDLATLGHWLDLAIREGKVQVVKYLLDRGTPMPKKMTWESILHSAMLRDQVNMVEYILSTYPKLASIDTLKKAASSDPYIFQVVLRSTSADPSSHLTEMLKPSRELVFGVDMSPDIRGKVSLSTPYDEYNFRMQEIASILVRDDRIKVEKLTIEEIRLVLWRLGSKLDSVIYGYNRGRDMASGGTSTRREIGAKIEQDNLYGLLLRLLFIKRPSGDELAKWMIDSNNRAFELAARSVIDASQVVRESEQVIVRGLMLSMLYPTMRLEEAIEELRLEGTSKLDLVAIAQLIGAYLGENEEDTD